METDEREFTTADLANAGNEQSATLDVEQAEEEKQTTASPPAVLADGAEGRLADAASAPLFPSGEAARYREQWAQVQGEFVDQPRDAVEQADQLVADLMQRLAAQFSETRAELERRWDGHGDVSTEELRIAMTQYRSFFERLLEA
jgi:hypothetical protein